MGTDINGDLRQISTGSRTDVEDGKGILLPLFVEDEHQTLDFVQ